MSSNDDNCSLEWKGVVPKVIRKRILAESKHDWSEFCSSVNIEGGFNLTRVCFNRVSFSRGWIHRRWSRLVGDPELTHRKTIEARFIANFLQQSNPKWWLICQQLDRQGVWDGIVADGLGDLYGADSLFRRFIFPMLADPVEVEFPGLVKTVTFNLSNHYPFRGADSIKIGGYDYYRILCPIGLKYHHQIARGCMCCQSLSCRDRWSPMIQLYLVVIEICWNIGLRRRIREWDMADRVIHWWTPWNKGRIKDRDRMLWEAYIPVELRIREFL